MIGFFVWGDVPTTALLVGSAIVVASGMFLLLARGQAALTRVKRVTGGREASICASLRAIEASLFHSAMSSGTLSIGTAGRNR